MKPEKIIRRVVFELKSNYTIRVVSFFLLLLILSSWFVFVIENSQNEGFKNFFDSVWWTIVTISTVGYGDRFPETTGGRFLAIFIILIGMAVMGVVTGKIASILMGRKMNEQKGLLNYRKLKGHYVICGWKREMEKMLKEVLSSNSQMDPSEIVLLNEAGEENMGVIFSDIRFRGIKYVYGDYIEEKELERAGVRGASRVLVLADYMTDSAGDIQQLDTKTVISVMAIRALNKRAYVCAELLDRKYEKYLKMYNCDEIYFSREFSRYLLSRASSGKAISHIYSELMSEGSGVSMTTADIPADYIGKEFSQLKQGIAESDNGSMVIGIIENTGNIRKRKNEALQHAQKDPDISSLVVNLKEVKHMVANRPVINPPADYIVGRHSKYIVIKGSSDHLGNEKA